MHQILTISNNEIDESTIHIGIDLIQTLAKTIDLSSYSSVFVLIDSQLPDSLSQTIKAALGGKVTSINVECGDKNKSIQKVQTVWDFLLRNEADRKSLLIIAGGGVLTDLGSFAAATYMRGIECVCIPTTLLSQVDASVGGKNGFNYGGVKNLIGLFKQPKVIIIDPNVLQSLPERQLISGFAEVIKHGLIADKVYFHQVTSKHPRDYSLNELAKIIGRSCQIKLDIIQDDIHEAGQRKIVNFGHTVGHAVESLSQETERPLLHGEAVSIGMAAEAMMAQAIGLLEQTDVDLIKDKLALAGLPTIWFNSNTKLVMERMKSDKKNEKQQINFTLIDAIGHARINQSVPILVQSKILQEIVGA